MKVVTESKNKWKMKVECTGKGNDIDNARKGNLPCNSMLEIEASDLFVTYSGGNYLEAGDIVNYTCECPICHAYTDIPGSKLPNPVKEYVEHKKRNSDQSRDSGMDY